MADYDSVFGRPLTIVKNTRFCAGRVCGRVQVLPGLLRGDYGGNP